MASAHTSPGSSLGTRLHSHSKLYLYSSPCFPPLTLSCCQASFFKKKRKIGLPWFFWEWSWYVLLNNLQLWNPGEKLWSQGSCDFSFHPQMFNHENKRNVIFQREGNIIVFVKLSVQMQAKHRVHLLLVSSSLTARRCAMRAFRVLTMWILSKLIL